MRIRFDINVQMRIIDTYWEMEEWLLRERELQIDRAVNTKKYWKGEAGDSFRKELEEMFYEGRYAVYLKKIRNMREVMENFLPKLRWLQSMLEDLPETYGLPFRDRTPGVLYLEESELNKWNNDMESRIKEKQNICEELERAVAGADEFTDVSLQRQELEEARAELGRMEDCRRKINEYADEIRYADGWLEKEMFPYIMQEQDEVSDTVSGNSTSEGSDENVFDCYEVREELDLSRNSVEECMALIEELHENGYVSEKDYSSICHIVNMLGHVPGAVEQINMERLQDLFQHIATTVYVHQCLQILGANMSAQECTFATAVMRDFSITNWQSIACFLICCCGESGNLCYVQEDYDPEQEYSFDERGAGYLQLTFKESQADFLTYMNEQYGLDIEINPQLDGYSDEVAQYPWQSAGWVWQIASNMKGNNYNNYVIERLEDNDGHLTLGVVLTVESFIHGDVNTNNHVGEITMDTVLAQIARGEMISSVNGGLDGGWYIVGSDTNCHLHTPEGVFTAPSNWEDFEQNYNLLMQAGLLE